MSGTTRYVALWAAGAIAAAALLILLHPPAAAPDLAVLLFLALTAIAERADLRLPRGDDDEAITLNEAAIAAAILLFPPSWALLATVGGVAIAHATKRPPPLKLAFNVAQYTVAIIAALAVSQLVGGGPGLDAVALLGVAAGMLVFGLVNTVAVSGILSLVTGRHWTGLAFEDVRLVAAMLLGNTAVGILTALVWSQRPALVALIVVPALSLQIAYRGMVRSKQLLASVEVERDRLDRVVAGASDGIVLVGADGRVEVWSSAMTRLTGIPSDEALGSPVGEVFAGTDDDGKPVDAATSMAAADVSAPVDVVEMSIAHRAGGERVARARHTVLFDDHGDCAGDIILVHDVTREREVEGLKDDFVARVSHELRTPLTPIKGFAQTLARRPDMAVELRVRALEQIADRADHMTRLIDDLLLVSRISRGQADLSDQVSPTPFDLVEVTERLVDVFRIDHPDREFTVEVGGCLPRALADPVRVEQTLANLLSNACKYSPAGTPVTVRLSAASREVVLAVSDRGRGIPPDHLDRVFERFHRVESPLRMQTGGIGLGLFIVRELITAMDGRIEVESRLGAGSTFTVHLPAAVRALDDAPAVRTDREPIDAVI